MSEQSSLTFHGPNYTEAMRIGPDGRFFVKGREVETDEEIRDTFLAWVRLCLAQQGWTYYESRSGQQ